MLQTVTVERLGHLAGSSYPGSPSQHRECLQEPSGCLHPPCIHWLHAANAYLFLWCDGVIFPPLLRRICQEPCACGCFLWCCPASPLQDGVVCGQSSEATAVCKGLLIVQVLLRNHVRVAVSCGGMQLYFHDAAFEGKGAICLLGAHSEAADVEHFTVQDLFGSYVRMAVCGGGSGVKVSRAACTHNAGVR